jgi:N-acylneuraminate cytidylyltransferase
MTLCIIPARGGSRRIPGKNIRELAGRPMIAHSIGTARESGLFDRILVSTDSEEVARVADAWGAEIPFNRPAELADDFTGTNPVIRHALQWLRERGECPEVACCLYATAPLLSVADLVRGWRTLKEADAAFAVSVTTFDFPIQRALREADDGRLVPVDQASWRSRSQDLEERYHDAGQFYWGRTAAWLAGSEFFQAPTEAVLLPRHRVQDVDTPEDWQRMELMYQTLLGMADG